MTTDYSRSAHAVIDLSALEHNLKVVKHYSEGAGIVAVIKSDAYGHGMLEVAKKLADSVAAFAVACVNEALLLRHYGIKNRIIALQGFDSREALFECCQKQIIPLVHCESQIVLLENHLPANLSIWLKFDTGMGRLGFYYQNWQRVIQRIKQIKGINIACIASHLSDADNALAEKNAIQQQAFEAIQPDNSIDKSLLNSAGLLLDSFPRYQWIRPGIMLYGVHPVPEKQAEELDLKPVMTLKAPIIAIKSIPKGGYVGYGSQWQAKQDTRVGIVSIGYGDGYPRAVKSGIVVYNNQQVEIIGRVSMDLLVIKLDKLNLSIGDEVVLWGSGLPVEKIANKADTIPYELLCSVAKVKHNYKDHCTT